VGDRSDWTTPRTTFQIERFDTGRRLRNRTLSIYASRRVYASARVLRPPESYAPPGESGSATTVLNDSCFEITDGGSVRSAAQVGNQIGLLASRGAFLARSARHRVERGGAAASEAKPPAGRVDRVQGGADFQTAGWPNCLPSGPRTRKYVVVEHCSTLLPHRARNPYKRFSVRRKNDSATSLPRPVAGPH